MQVAEGNVLLKLTRVEKCYTEPGGSSPLSVLRGCDMELAAGESVAIVGPSGSGKSTLLNIIGTLDYPDAGCISFAGNDLTALNERTLAGVRARDIGFVFQLHHLLPQLTVLENVFVPTLAEGLEERKELADTRARRLLKIVGLSDRLEYRPGQLSGGERQRVAVVRALINEPKLLLADEPTGSLDSASADNLALLLGELNREEGVSLIVVTHSVLLAKQMSRVLELRDGVLGRASGSK